MLAKLKDLLLVKNSTVAIFNNIKLCQVLGENKLKTGACSEKNGWKIHEPIKDGKQERKKAGTETDHV